MSIAPSIGYCFICASGFCYKASIIACTSNSSWKKFYFYSTVGINNNGNRLHTAIGIRHFYGVGTKRKIFDSRGGSTCTPHIGIGGGTSRYLYSNRPISRHFIRSINNGRRNDNWFRFGNRNGSGNRTTRCCISN